MFHSVLCTLYRASIYGVYYVMCVAFISQIKEEVAKLLELKAKLGDDAHSCGKFVLKCAKVWYMYMYIPPIVGRHLYMYYIIVLYMCIHVVLYMFIVVRRTLTFACISPDLSLTLVLSGRAHGIMTRSRWPFARRSSPSSYRASRGTEQSPSAHQSLN